MIELEVSWLSALLDALVASSLTEPLAPVRRLRRCFGRRCRFRRLWRRFRRLHRFFWWRRHFGRLWRRFRRLHRCCWRRRFGRLRRRFRRLRRCCWWCRRFRSPGIGRGEFVGCAGGVLALCLPAICRDRLVRGPGGVVASAADDVAFAGCAVGAGGGVAFGFGTAGAFPHATMDRIIPNATAIAAIVLLIVLCFSMKLPMTTGRIASGKECPQWARVASQKLVRSTPARPCPIAQSVGHVPLPPRTCQFFTGRPDGRTPNPSGATRLFPQETVQSGISHLTILRRTVGVQT